MKKMILSLVALIAATVSYAQNTLVATLSHGEDITMYYGSYALRDAYNAAVSGDIINLSGGAFQAVNFNKALTLRGTGIDDANPTYIIGDYTINIPAEDTNRLSMEGIRCTGTITISGTLSNTYFLKSQFYGFTSSESTIKNAMFANCKITHSFILRGTSTTLFVNCYVSGFSNENQINTGASFINCIIFPYSYGYWADLIQRSELRNCIFFQISEKRNLPNSKLSSTSIASNCIAIGYHDFFSSQAANTGNWSVNYDEFNKVFKDFTGSYSDSQTFELADEAKTTYIGTDGTEVGIYGGLLPYDSTPSYPQIKRMNVAKKTTADGKLSVEIEVSAAE